MFVVAKLRISERNAKQKPKFLISFPNGSNFGEAKSNKFFSFPQTSSSFFVVSCLLPIGEIHADEDQGGTDEEEDGDALVEYEPRKDNRGDGIDVNVVGGRDGTDGLQRPVPRHKAHH